MTRAIEELLPFYANGTLDGAERAEVETALAQDADLRAELAVLVAIRDQMQAEPVQSPGELGLARLMREVEREAAPATAPVAMPDTVVPLRRHRLWQIAAAVGLALVVAQTAYLVTTQATDPGFELAGEQEAAARAPAFTVGFAEDATEGAIRALLLEAGLEIVAGPSALGLYELAPRDGIDLEAAAAVLTGAGPDVVETWTQTAED